MKHYLLAILSIAAIFTSALALAGKPAGSVYLDGGTSKVALILAHGRGKHPTWKVVDPLRKGVNDSLGYHTLSLQMPNEDKKWKEYADDFPDAYTTIKNGIRYLKDEKGIEKIFLMGHSMGSRMASAFVSENPDQTVTGLVVAGCRNNGGHPLSCEKNLQGMTIPVLDIWGGNNAKDTAAANDREVLASGTYKQVEVPGANHKFEGDENKFVTLVIDWLKTQQ